MQLSIVWPIFQMPQIAPESPPGLPTPLPLEWGRLGMNSELPDVTRTPTMTAKMSRTQPDGQTDAPRTLPGRSPDAPQTLPGLYIYKLPINRPCAAASI